MADFSIGNVKHWFQGFRKKSVEWINIANAGDQIQDILDKIRDRIRAIETRIASLEVFAGGSSQYVIVKKFFVTANLTVPLPDEPAGSVLLYVFVGDGNGAWTVTVPTEFKGLFSPRTLEATAGITSSFMMLKNSPTEYVPVMAGIWNVRTS